MLHKFLVGDTKKDQHFSRAYKAILIVYLSNDETSRIMYPSVLTHEPTVSPEIVQFLTRDMHAYLDRKSVYSYRLSVSSSQISIISSG